MERADVRFLSAAGPVTPAALFIDGSGHLDRFARDRLPPGEQWPSLCAIGVDIDHPARLNAVAELLDVWIARGHGERPCLIGGSQVWSYARVAATVDRIARVLVEDYGLVAGNRVLLRGPNTPMLVACWLAVVKAGGIAVATMTLLRGGEIGFILTKARIDIALCDSRFTDDLLAAQAHLPAGRSLPPVIPFNAATADAMEARAALKPTGFPAAATAADDIAVIAFTSGTTGAPKATAHFHRDLLTVADLSPRSILNAGPDDVFCGTPSIAFAYGLGGMLLFPLRVGASVALVERPTPENMLDAIARSRATLLFTVPTAYRAMTALMESRDAGRDATASLRACVSAGEPLPGATFEAWERRTGLRILDSLGTTEMLNAVLHARPEDLRPGSSGKPVPGYEAIVVDDQFRRVPAGQVGRLAVRGPTGCRYLDDDRQTGYVHQGWNLTGDAVHVDADGYFWYHGRTDDLIVSCGYKISGLEVEDALLHHDVVDECAVIAVPDPLRGTVPKAFVVVREGVHPTGELARELQDHVKATIAPFKYPRAIEFLEHLPRTGTGKIQRYKLRQREWEGAE